VNVLGRHELWWVLAVGGAAVGSFFLFRTPEPARSGLTLLESACGAPADRAALVERHVAESLVLDLADVPDVDAERRYSRSELLEQLMRLDELWPGCAVRLDDWRLRPQADGAEWLEGVLVYSESQPGDLHGNRRRLRALFRTRGGVPQLERLILGPVERRLPEARP
jgi:hypothetical protein